MRIIKIIGKFIKWFLLRFAQGILWLINSLSWKLYNLTLLLENRSLNYGTATVKEIQDNEECTYREAYKIYKQHRKPKAQTKHPYHGISPELQLKMNKANREKLGFIIKNILAEY